MKHLVFIVDNYYPNFSAVGSCVNNVVNNIKDKCKVTVLTCVSQHNQELEFTHNGYKVIRIAPKKNLRRLKVEHNMENSAGVKRKINKVLHTSLRSRKYIKAVIGKYNIENDVIKGYLSALNNIDDPIDAIIPACIPFEAVLAGIKFGEENNIKVIPYFFDPFADNEALHRTKSNKEKKMEKHLKLEEFVIKNSEKVLMMNHMVNHFQECFSQYSSKFVALEHPTLIIDDKEAANERDKDNEKINLTYAGAFNKGIREPDYLLKLMAASKANLQLNLYSVGNCSSVIKEYADNNPEKILNHGSVDKKTAHAALNISDILVSVGNVVSNQTPSKIFEYIAMGKPLIHLYYNQDDEVINILKRYELALCIKQGNEVFNENLRLVEEFCFNNLNKTMSKEKIKELYKEALPETTGKVILDLL